MQLEGRVFRSQPEEDRGARADPESIPERFGYDDLALGAHLAGQWLHLSGSLSNRCRSV